MDYDTFLRAKAAIAPAVGRRVDDADLHPILKPHQRLIAQWAALGGRRAIFAAFGLGKSILQLETLRHVTPSGGRALIVCPLGVRGEFRADAAIRKGGHEPVSPLSIQGQPDWSWWQWMDACIPLLKTCQGIYMLPGWRESHGATVEWYTAQALGLRLFGYELEHP